MPNNVVSTLKIGNQVYDIKDSYIRNLVTSVLEITAENNEIISNRLNNLNDRAFNNLIKVENDNWSNVNSIQSGIYRIEHSSNNAVTEYSILINKQDANTQLNIRNNDIYYRNKVNGVWGDWTVLTPNLSLSSNYTQSSLENAQLHLSPNDSFELAFSKLEKAIMDNERIAAASLNDLNSRIETINDIGAEANVQSDWEESDSTSDAYIANKPFESVNEAQFIVDSTTNELSINKDILPVDYSKQYLTFVATEAGTFTFRPGKNNIISYSTDNGSTWTEGSSIEVNSGDKVLWKGTMTPISGNGIGYFSSTGKFDVQGNVMSLLYGDDFKGEVDLTEKSDAFVNLFRGNTKVVSAENLSLPATTLASSCYSYMFFGCTSLTTAPVLPATTLASNCYDSMFSNCTVLVTAPVLPATTLVNKCYYNMFSGCTALVTAPSILPATTLADSCYQSMFSGCKSLTTAPELPATTLVNKCYYYMFSGCTALVTAPSILPATTLASYCYQYMFNGCTALVTAPSILLATTLVDDCCQSMFQNCTSLTTAPELPVTTLASYCYRSMFSGCKSLTTAPELPATTLADGCYYNMFSGCTALVTAPVLPATTLVSSCYSRMFQGCSSLNYIKAMFTTTPSTTYTSNWVSGVSSSGTFVKNSEATWDVTGDNGIPTGWNVYTDAQWKEVKRYELDALEDSLDDVHETIASALNDLDSRIEAIDEVGAQANVIEAIKVNDELLPITNKTVNIYNSYTIELREIWSDNKALVEFKDSTITPETLITILNKYNYNNVVFKLFDEIDGFPPSNYYFNLDLSQLICNITYDEQNNTITSISSFVIIDLKDSSLVSILNTNNQFYIVSWNENDNKWEFALHRVQTGITSYAYTDLNPHETTTTISAFDTDGKNNNAKIELIGKENANKNAEINITTETNDGLKWNRRVVAVEEYCEKTKEYYSKQYLTFVAKENGTFTFTPQNNNVISYSINGSNWIEDNEVAVSNGDKVLWKGSMAVSLNGIGKFSSTANFDVQGNIMSLLYGDEFIGKTDLTGKNYAFYQLFYNNTKVVSAENLILPATMLADSCYRDMFDGCTSLTTAPSILPATTLTDSCYRTMFTFCTSLTKAPELPATMLASYCYGAMFYNCTSLNYIKAMFLTIPNVSCTRNWVCGVSSTGTFIKNSSASWDVRGYDGVPEYWNNYLSTEINTINNKIQKIDPLILANNEYYIQKSNSVILPLSHPDLSTQPSILPERFGKYYIYEVMVPIFGDNIINDLSNTSDEEIYVYEKNNESYLAFKEGGLLMNDSTIINASLIGNGVYDNPTIIKDEIIEEIDYANEYLTFVAKESGTFTFTPNNDNVISYSIDNGLTWTEGNNVTINNGDKVLWKGSMTPNNSGIGAFSSTANFDAQGNIMSLLYGDEFIGQTDLTGNNNIFNRLFYQNTKIVSAKNLILPATILAPNCYEEMFNGCGSLTTAPELPATTLAESCYDSMFANCTALTTAPELPATTLTIGCYASMFYHCGMLNYIKAMFTTTPTVSYTSIWVDGVSNTGTFVKNSAATWNVTGNNGIPSGWTVDTVSYEDTPYEYSTIGINSKFKINKIYTNLPLSTYASKMNYLLVKYYNDQYLGYYENYYE